MIASGVQDADKVATRSLNLRYGLPVNSVDTSDKLYPTIPTEMVRRCKKPAGHLGKLPFDQQAIMVAAAFVMYKSTLQKSGRHFGTSMNPGTLLFGDPGYRPLTSFKTL